MADNISATLQSITNALNMTVTAFQGVQDTASNNIDTNAISGIREQLNAATIATQQFQDELDKVKPKTVPIEVIPIWDTETNIQIFQGNDLARYSQEVQSTNDLLIQLTSNQNQISQQAATMNLLPPNAVNEINSVGSRIEALQNQIAEVQKNRVQIVGVERANAEMEALRQQLQNAVQSQNDMNAAIKDMDISAANRAYNELNYNVDSVERYIRDNINEQRIFNDEINKGEKAANSLKSALVAMVGAFTIGAGVSFIKGSINLTNQQIQAEQQLVNVMANAGATQADFLAMKEKAASIQASGMYGDEIMIGGAAELSTYIKDTEALQSMMNTLTNYAAGMSGGAAVGYQEMVNYATQLGKALDGTYDGLKKKGFELTDAQKKIIETGTDMEKALVIDDVINQSWANLYQQMSNTPQGKIEQIKNTFGDIREEIGAQLYPVVLKILNTIQTNLPQIQSALYGVIPAIQFIIQILGGIFNISFAIYKFFNDNWSIISPIIYAGAGAWGVYTVAVNMARIAQIKNLILTKTSALATGALTTAKTIAAFATWAFTGATLAQAGAQWGLNAALLACPLTWVLIAIIAIIGIIYLVIAAVNKFAGTSISATGVIFGVFTWLGSVIANIFIGCFELIFGLVNYLVNPFISFANFLANVFNNPVSSVIYLFTDMVDNVLAMLQKIASAMDFVFGTKMGDTIKNWRSGLKDMADSVVQQYAPNENYQKVIDNVDFSVENTLGWSRFNNTDAYNEGYRSGENINFTFGSQSLSTPSDFVDMSILNGNTSAILANTNTMKDISEDELKYFRDIAEREAINRFTTAEVKVEMGGINNNVNSSMDLDSMIDYISEGTREGLQTVANGVYA